MGNGKEVFDAELFGLLQMLEIFLHRYETGRCYSIFSDSEAATRRLRSDERCSGPTGDPGRLGMARANCSWPGIYSWPGCGGPTVDPDIHCWPGPAVDPDIHGWPGLPH